MIIRGMEQMQAWTMRKEFERSLEVSDSRRDENIDKYKCHKYKKNGDGTPTISRANMKTPLSLYLFFKSNHIPGFIIEGSISIQMMALY